MKRRKEHMEKERKKGVLFYLWWSFVISSYMVDSYFVNGLKSFKKKNTSSTSKHQKLCEIDMKNRHPSSQIRSQIMIVLSCKISLCFHILILCLCVWGFKTETMQMFDANDLYMFEI